MQEVNVLKYINYLNAVNETYFQSFKTAEIVPKSGKRIIEPMAQELKYMFDQKVSAVRVSFNKLSP